MQLEYSVDSPSPTKNIFLHFIFRSSCVFWHFESINNWKASLCKSLRAPVSLSLYFLFSIPLFPSSLSLWNHSRSSFRLFWCTGRLLLPCIVLAAWENSISCKELSIYGPHIFVRSFYLLCGWKEVTKSDCKPAEWPISNPVVVLKLCFVFLWKFESGMII